MHGSGIEKRTIAVKRRLILFLAVLLAAGGTARAQWVTFDPSNLAQGIVNSTKQVVEASTTAQNMIRNFQETVKIYQQGKKYYDALRSVHNLVRDARKVQECVLMVGEIGDVYVNNFRRMLSDENYTVDELSAIAFGYTKLLEQGSFLLDDLRQVVSVTGLQMTDRERMEVVENIYQEVREYRNLTDYYTRKNISVSYLRSKKAGDLSQVRALYGSHDDRYW